MNYPDPTSRRWCYPDNAGETAAEDYNFINSIADMFGDYTTDDDLFELVWRGGTLPLKMEEEEPVVSCLCLSPRFKPPSVAVRVPEMLPSPPSEDEMATWLSAIVQGKEHEHAHGGGERGWTDNNGRRAPSEKSSETSMETNKATSRDKNKKLPTAEYSATKETGTGTGSDGSSKMRKMTAGAMSHHGKTHKFAEKRRRCKINERLKTLQHLVPGCDKSSYTSTLDHTIQYMKTLQQQVQVMTGDPSSPAAAVHPAVQPRYVPPGPPVTLAPTVLLGPPPMAPLRHLLPFAHYSASVVMMPAATTPPMYAATPTPMFAPAAGSLGQGLPSSLRRKQ